MFFPIAISLSLQIFTYFRLQNHNDQYTHHQNPKCQWGIECGYGAKGGRLWTTTVPNSLPVISNHMDPLTDTLMEAHLRQTSTWSKMSPAGYRQLTQFIQRQILALVPMWKKKHIFQRQLRGSLVCSICYQCVMKTSRSEKKPSVSEGLLPYFCNSFVY